MDSRFILSVPEDSLLYFGNYDYLLVTLSVAIAVLASYAALLISQQVVSTDSGVRRNLWITIGGISLGCGIWSMHFVGMLAFNLPCTTNYDPTLTILSTLPGIAASILAIDLISHPTLSRRRMMMGGLLIGAGIGTMHYAGMEAMRLNGFIRYDLSLFLLSIVVAVLLASIALWVKFQLQSWHGKWQSMSNPLSALLMGFAVSGMHYTAMSAAYFFREETRGLVQAGLEPTFLAAIILTVTGMIVFVTIVVALTGQTRLFIRGKAYGLIILSIFGWIFISWTSSDYYHQRQTLDIYQRELELSSQQADVIARGITEAIGMLKGIPFALANQNDVIQLVQEFEGKTNPSTLAYEVRKERWTTRKTHLELNRKLKIAADHLKADVIWVMNAAGDCIASSNSLEADSFIGNNYKDRQYFTEARNGNPGNQYAVGRSSNIPGLYYSYPIIVADKFLGAVIVKRNIPNLVSWIQNIDAFITDMNGVIILASDRSIEFKALPDAPVFSLDKGHLLKQYKQDHIEAIRFVQADQHNLPSAYYFGDSQQLKAITSIPLPSDSITVSATRPLAETEKLDNERYWLFFLLSSVGSLLIIAAAATVMYLRESRRASQDLQVAASAFETQDGMLISDANNLILRVNSAFTEITGYDSDAVVGKNPSILSSGKHDSTFYAAMWESINNSGIWKGEVLNRRKNGEIYPEYLTITAVKDDNGKLINYVASMTDISKRKAAEDEIRNLAFFDPLTKLPNRRLLLDRIQHALSSSARTSRKGALLFIDLDNFKTLNDTLGHDMGDLLLKQVAERLQSCVREDDTVARLGGDEFVVMLLELSQRTTEAAAQTQSIADKIISTLNRPYQLDRHQHLCSPSIGITLIDGHQHGIEELFKQADIAMYQSKREGRNTMRFFDHQMQFEISERALLENELRQALKADQFRLYYQLQVDEHDKVLGVEALLRWINPKRGMVSPALFIPLAEETGLILGIGKWVIDTACKQIKLWKDEPLTQHLTIAVNVSGKQFLQQGFSEQVSEAIRLHDIPPSRLKMELTESMLLDNIERTIEVMNGLRQLGIRFSLDDFGTGFSSLQYLKRLPLDQIKIDQTFVRDLVKDDNDKAIVKTTIAMSKSMDLDVIAEGVENGEQRNLLVKMGCTRFQGYLFSKPIPIEDLERVLKNRD